MKPATRAHLIAQMQQRLSRGSAPRLELLLIIVLAGVAAFLVSAGSLRLGLSSMAIRYPLAVAGGYLTFIALIRCWIAWQRRGVDSDDRVNALDVVSNLPLDVVGDDGGSSRAAVSEAVSVDLDFDELWPVVLAAMCVLGGVVAIGYAIYAAPLLLAEVAVDAAVVSTLYRRMRREDGSHWAVTTVRRTWIPALVVVVCAAIGGFALQQIAPDARSIGGVVRAISD